MTRAQSGANHVQITDDLIEGDVWAQLLVAFMLVDATVLLDVPADPQGW